MYFYDDFFILMCNRPHTAQSSQAFQSYVVFKRKSIGFYVKKESLTSLLALTSVCPGKQYRETEVLTSAALMPV